MKRWIIEPILVAVMAVPIASVPVGAQLAGATTFEPELIDAGAEPRQLLRYRWVEGATETQTMRMEMRAWGTLDGVPMMDTTTATEMLARYEVTDVLADGSARIEMVTEAHDVSLVDATESGAQEDTAGFDLDGMSGSMMVDTRGHISVLDMDLPDDLAPELRQQIEGSANIVMPMPEEPVGVGAIWESAASMASSGLPAEMLTRTEVLEIDEQRVLLGMTMYLDAEAMETALIGGMPPEAEATVDSYEFDGGGRIEVSYSSFVPNTTASSDMAVEASFLAPQDDEVISMTMVIGSSMAMTQTRGE